MREFNTAAWASERSAEQKAEADERFGWDIEVPIDGRKVKFVGASPSAISLVIASSQADLIQKVAAVTNFFFALIADQKDKDWLRQRLWDNSDPFDVGMIEEISLALIEEWGARPTQSASTSSGSQQPSGRRSTAKHRSGGSTRSASPSTAS